jgi:hypothetical protein
MSEADRSRLIYLLDALRVSPEKSRSLISVLMRQNNSEALQRVLDELTSSTDIIKDEKRIRERMR